jgi:hypothetical protein
VAVAARLFDRPLGAAEDVSLGVHPGWYRYAPGRSGFVGLLCMTGFVLTGMLKIGRLLGPFALVGLALGVSAAPLVFAVQRKRSARAVPLSIR